MVRYLVIIIALTWSATLLGQASIQGKVIDEAEDMTVPFATIQITRTGEYINATSSDIDGNYYLGGLSAGTYDLELSFVGYSTVRIEDLKLSADQVLQLDLVFPKENNAIDLEGITVVAYEDLEIFRQPCCAVIDKEIIENNPNRNVITMVANSPGISQKDEGESFSVNGGRSGSSDTYVGMTRLIGGINLSETEIEEIKVYTNGIPVEFGDVTGAVISITPKGPSRYFSGSVQLESSQYLDAFGYNRADMSFSGPILLRDAIDDFGNPVYNADSQRMKQSVLGYRLSGTMYTTRDDRPSALPSFKLSDDKVAELHANPLIRTSNGGLVLATDFLTEEDIEEVAVRPNARTSTGLFNGSLVFKPNNDYVFTLGGQLQYDWGKEATVGNRLLNYDFNRDFRSSNWLVYGHFKHNVSSTKSTGENTSPFQNFRYEIQGDYSQVDFSIEDPRYKDRFFDYGYVGKVYRSLIPVIGAVDTNYITNTIGDTIGTDIEIGHASNQITFGGFEASDINAGLAAYNNLLDYSEITSMEELEITNGRFIGNRLSAYSLFNSPHNTGSATTEGAGFGKSNQTQVRGTVKTQFDLVSKDKQGNPLRHSITMGGVYEQRVERSYNISPFALWNLADQSANSHLSFATDRNRPNGGEYFDPFTQRYYQTYDPLIREDDNGELVQMSQFGEEVRNALNEEGEGNYDQYDWVNVHELTPDQMDLSFFEPTTLILGRQQVMSYYGYDYLGNVLGTSTDFNDFFLAEDATTGRKTRPVAPFKPIYIAGYLQDQFTFRDITCRLGVRFDSYDANTQVLRDPYSIAGYYSADEFFSNGVYAAADGASQPTNIGDDYAVYVSDNSAEASIVGYRDGDQWYDADGVPVNDPRVLGQTIIPALQGFSTAENDPQGENYDPTLAFRDYNPSLLVMPRLSIVFPINENASFYGSYDILSRRPTDGNFASALTYFNFRELATSSTSARFIPNPNLRPQRTISYEVGYQQRLGENASLKLSMMYREERDLIQLRQYAFAYPVTYQTYGNDDFSTVKAFKLEYDMQRVKNLRIMANYTLQFAEGTGSSPTSSQNIAAQDLRYIFPLDFDQRHTFYVNLDYRYGQGKDYQGPSIKKRVQRGDSLAINEVNLLENMGLNVAFNANSGTPYTSRQIPGGIGTSFPNRVTEGSVNGARTPWNFRVDLRLDRDFVIGRFSKNPIELNIYVRVQNVLNTQNILNVYAATGSPTDDGFLTNEASNGGALLASNPESYEMLYNLRMNNPFNISRPRRIFVGAKFKF